MRERESKRGGNRERERIRESERKREKERGICGTRWR